MVQHKDNVNIILNSMETVLPVGDIITGFKMLLEGVNQYISSSKIAWESLNQLVNSFEKYRMYSES